MPNMKQLAISRARFVLAGSLLFVFGLTGPGASVPASAQEPPEVADPDRLRIPPPELEEHIQESLERALTVRERIRVQGDTVRLFPFGERRDTILIWPPSPRFEFPRDLSPLLLRPFGIRLMDLNEELGAYFGRDEGVLVLEVVEDAPLPLRGGDVILAIHGREVRDAAHARDILRSYRSGEEIGLRVLRRGEAVTVEGRAR